MLMTQNFLAQVPDRFQLPNQSIWNLATPGIQMPGSFVRNQNLLGYGQPIYTQSFSNNVILCE